MREALRRALFTFLRIPPEPRVPSDDGGRVRVFRAAPNFYRYNLIRWGLAQLGALSGLIVGVTLARTFSGTLERFSVLDVVFWIELLAWIAFFAQLPVTYLMLRLDYDLRWYIVTDRSLRIREGLNRIREQTMTFANVQNMSVRQGPLQRLLGISDVEVHTAGGGGGGEAGGSEGAGKRMHVGTFRGVDNGEEVRDTIRARVRRYRDAGLGDPDDPGPREVSPAGKAVGPAAGASPRAVPLAAGPLLAARELLVEVRRLREGSMGGAA